ncbi:MAG TPA: hypothetical protein VGO11_26420 [Chthoniobacteraceae bacterium]|jgi:hypothetical protein|nr:hypothetical protein [Chthoniobacteraceae bacterium]
MKTLIRSLTALVKLGFAIEASAVCNYNMDVQNKTGDSRPGIALEFNGTSLPSISDPCIFINGRLPTSQFRTSGFTVHQLVSPPFPLFGWAAQFNPTAIQGNDWVHIGFSVPGNTVNLKRGIWLQGNWPSYSEVIGAAFYRVPRLQIHTKGKTLEFSNGPSGLPRTSQAIVIEDGTVEYYREHQPLRRLNATSKRKPMLTVRLDLGERVLKDGRSFKIPYQPPLGARFAVFHFTTRGLSHSGLSRSWAEFQLF